MSLLQSIVRELDGELARLHTLRELVIELRQAPTAVPSISSCPVVPPTQAEPMPAAVLTLLEPPKPQRKVRADAGRPRGRRGPKAAAAAEIGALTKSVPAGPVVFSATQLAEEKARREQARTPPTPAAPEATPEDLDALSRSLAARWSSGLVQ